MSPRIAMATLVTGRIPTGVLHSVQGQARIARANGIALDYFIVNGERQGDDDAIHLERYSDSRLGTRSDRWLKARRLRSVSRLGAYDVLLLRYPTGLDVDPTALFRGSSQKIATVHHTKELEEQLSPGLKPSSLVRWAFERINGPRILRSVDGIVGVTDEIRDYEVARTGRSKPATTVANGVDVSRVPHTRFTPFDGSTLRLLFVASDPSPWHGIDRLVNSFRTTAGPRVIIDVVGEQGRPAGAVEPLRNGEARYHGVLRGPSLDALAGKATLAVATLGLHRKGLRQACSLKTREYLARGLPVVLGYDDVDVRDELPFVLRVPSSEAHLRVEELVAFAERMARRPDVADEARAFASETLDWKHKLNRLVAFGASL